MQVQVDGERAMHFSDIYREHETVNKVTEIDKGFDDFPFFICTSVLNILLRL